MRAAPGLLSHYDLAERRIYFGVHDPADTHSTILLGYLTHLLALRHDELLALFASLSRWTVAHELAHHVRHQAGMYAPDDGEETAAHELAAAACRDAPDVAHEAPDDLLAAGLRGLMRHTGEPARTLRGHFEAILAMRADPRLTYSRWIARHLTVIDG